MISIEANTAKEIKPLSFLSGLESVRDLLSYLTLKHGSIEKALGQTENEEDRALLERVMNAANHLNNLIPSAEQVALKTISFNQRQSLKEKPRTALGAEREREAEAIDLERVVIIPKISKIEYQMRKYEIGFDEAVLQLRNENGDVACLQNAHQAMKQGVEELKRYFRADQIMDRDKIDLKKIDRASLVIALGGDDHFCFVSQLVKGKTPILGMKGDSFSNGYLLASKTSQIPKLVRELEQGNYQFEAWVRLKVKVDGKELPPTVSTVFIGETMSPLTSRNLTKVEDEFGNRLLGTVGRGLEQRSSGLLVYTGTGSTGWALSAGGYMYPEGRTFPKTARYAELIAREPNRDPEGGHDIINGQIAHVVIHEGERLIVDSLNKDGGIVSADGFTVPFKRSSIAQIEIDPEPLWVVMPDLSNKRTKEMPTFKVRDPSLGYVSRDKIPSCYPERQLPPASQYSWNVACPSYRPAFFEHERLKTSSWAERADISKQEFIERKAKGLLQSCLGEVQLDAVSGLPLNPVGRTGISGRGLLGKFGANYAVDPLVIQKKENNYHLLVIQKEDGSWALPGGMIDAGEDVTSAVYRELHEETNILPEEVSAFLVKGWGETIYGDDPRSTDNAWTETTPRLFFLDAASAAKLNPKAGDDAKDVKWIEISEDSISKLYAAHAFMVAEAWRYLQER